MSEIAKKIVFLGRNLPYIDTGDWQSFHLETAECSFEVMDSHRSAIVYVGSQEYLAEGTDLKDLESNMRRQLCGQRAKLDSIVGFLGWKG